jgi:aspartyl protease family protein
MRTITVFMVLLVALPCMAIEKITVLGLFTDKAIVKIDNNQRLLKIGETSPEGVTLISANSREAILEIDGKRDTYTLGTHIGTNFSELPAETTVTIAPDSMGMYEVNGSINGFQVKFVVDTGATLISMNSQHARRIGLDFKLEGVESVTETASGYTKSYLVKLDKVRVGDIELHDVPGSVHDGDFPSVILLGNSFLSKVNMTRDGRILQLKK